MKKKQYKQVLPDGMTGKDVQAIIEYYDHQTEEEAIAEAEEVFGDSATTIIQIPRKLVPKVRALIAKEARAKAKRPKAA
ncbi:MAG: hypothetical protein GX442_18655 [Candidatus Riflebacteria bacterium]|nr:hypothetical protein [Candidatus Riflebacteria bacterium]